MLRLTDLKGSIIKYWDSGYSKVLGRFYGMINFILIGLTYLTLQGINVDLVTLALLFISMVIFIFMLGLAYVKFGFLGAEQKAMYEENPEFVDLKNKVTEIKKMLKEVIKNK